MKCILLIVFSSTVLLISCGEKRATTISPPPNATTTLLEIPDTSVDKSAVYYNNKTSLWTLNDKLYSGYVISYYKDGTLKEKIGILEGKKENQASKWYPDGHYKQTATYHKGKLSGVKRVWSSDTNHILLSKLNYKSGKPHGQQLKWYPSGELHKKLSLNMGQEQGIQQAFRKNGELYANYEAKDGRIFGLKKAALCYGLEDERVQYEK